jgi:hypothetical protein
VRSRPTNSYRRGPDADPAVAVSVGGFRRLSQQELGELFCGLVEPEALAGSVVELVAFIALVANVEITTPNIGARRQRAGIRTSRARRAPTKSAWRPPKLVPVGPASRPAPRLVAHAPA